LLRFARNDVDRAQFRRMGGAKRYPSAKRTEANDGYRGVYHRAGQRPDPLAPPILQKRRRATRPLADHPRNLAAPIPPPRDPNGLRIVQLYPLFSRIYGQNRLETLRTSDVGTIDR